MSVDLNAALNNAATGAYKLTTPSAKKEATKDTKIQEGASTDESAATAKSASSTGFGEAAVFERSSENSASTDSVNVKKSNDREAIISQLKADQEARQNQLYDIVRKTIEGQGKTIANSDDMWKFLAGGDFTVDAATKAKAQEDISEDGYWGVNQTSDRILDFAKALAGDDPSKADQMLDAFKKGYEEATKTWGKDLPDLTKQTFDAVIKKFEDWKNTGNTDANATASTATNAAATTEDAVSSVIA